MPGMSIRGGLLRRADMNVIHPRNPAMHATPRLGTVFTVLATALISSLTVVAADPASAAPVSYKVDPDHTYPSFEADHLGGLSVWRGKLNRSAGTVTLDRSAGNGTVDISVDLASIAFGQKALERWAVGKDFFDVTKYPKAHFQGRLGGFVDGRPTQAIGELALHGVTRPFTLKIQSFKCMPHPMLKREICGADAIGSFRRDEFGLDAGKDYGFDMNVVLRIQVEALAAS
jgi:polyisoprenoid-binding protein YceI